MHSSQADQLYPSRCRPEGASGGAYGGATTTTPQNTWPGPHPQTSSFHIPRPPTASRVDMEPAALVAAVAAAAVCINIRPWRKLRLVTM